MRVDEHTRRLDTQKGSFIQVTPYADGTTELVVRTDRASAIARLSSMDRAAVIDMLGKPTPEAAPPRQAVYMDVSVPGQKGQHHFECEVLPNGRVEATESYTDNPPIRFTIPDGIEPTVALLTSYLLTWRDGFRRGEVVGAEEVKLSFRALLGVPSQEQVQHQLGRLRLSIEAQDD